MNTTAEKKSFSSTGGTVLTAIIGMALSVAPIAILSLGLFVKPIAARLLFFLNTYPEWERNHA